VGDPQVLHDVLAGDAMLVTPEEAARLLRVGRTTVYALMKHGHLRPVHIGRSCRLPRAELERYVDGIPNAGLHTLRHSAASVMLTNGVPLKVVSEILGHSSIAITGDVYGHVSPGVSREAVRTLGDVLAELGRANGGQNGGQIVPGKEEGRSRSPGNGPDLLFLTSG